MTKRKNVILIAVILVAVLICALIAFGTVMAVKDYNKEIPLTDLTQTYKGEATDENGNLLVPFDVAYPEAFATGAYGYVEGELLIKMESSYKGKLTNNLKKCGFASVEKFADMEDGDWYRATLAEDTDILTAIQKARSLSEVLVADYNYTYQTEDLVVEETESESTDADHKGGEGGDGKGDDKHDDNDPFDCIEDVKGNGHWKDQHHLGKHKVQDSWKYLKDNGISPGGLSSVIVAVIDTGVDYNHPDLKANMWVNKDEIPGNGKDDDGNGYIDDVYGCSTIGATKDHTGNPMDDHGHGTHVAGIIGASNNKEGIVGIAYNAKIMAIKAGQATGVFNQSDIAEAILYAYEMGADVINMSFGGSACSISVQQALETAYTRSSLVASAGNSGKPNEKADFFKNYGEYLPNYPAALSYVIGVMSVDQNGVESGFTNWDANKYNAVEYEVYASGESIISTLPGGRYGKLSGTSMATPVVSATAALLRSYFSDRDMYPSKFISAQICATSGEVATCINPGKHTVNGKPHNIPMILDIKEAFTKLPKPDVNLSDYCLLDTEGKNDKNNGDGVVDAGEIIDIGVVLRNRWGMSKDTIVTIDTYSEAGIPNPYVELITDSTNFDGVGTYSTKSNYIYTENIVSGFDSPLTVKIKENCPNDYRIQLYVTITYKNGLDDKDTSTYTSKGVIEFWVRSGEVLPSQIAEDMTLTKDNYYIIPNSTVILEGVTVTVEAGTKIQFWSDDPNDPYAHTYMAKLNVEGAFITQGTAEEPVEMFPSEMMSNYRVEIGRNGGTVKLNYTTVTNPYISVNTADHCTFNQNYFDYICYRELSNGNVYDRTRWDSNCVSKVSGTVSNSLIYKCGSGDYSMKILGDFNTCAFVDSQIDLLSSTENTFTNCVFNGNYATNTSGNKYVSSATLNRYLKSISVNSISRNNTTGLTTVIFSATNNNYIPRTTFECLAEDLGGKITSYTYGYSSSTAKIEIPGSIYCEKIQFDKNGISIDLESKSQLNATAIPTTFDTSSLIYVSEDENIATVDKNGMITPISMGETRVFAYSPDYKIYDVITVNIVPKVPVTGISFSKDEIVLEKGAYTTLSPVLYPSNTTEQYVTYTSSDTSIATVDENGRVTGIGVGEATITATAQNGSTAQIKVRVEIFIKSITISSSDSSYYATQQLQLNVTVSPTDATEKLVFSTSNSSRATVDENGLVTFEKYNPENYYNSNAVTIYVKSESGKVSQSTTKYVKEPIKEFYFNSNLFSTYVGDTSDSWKPYVDAYIESYKIEYTSTNPNVAYVDENGDLVRVGDGVTLISATAKGSGFNKQQLCVYVGEESEPYELDIIDYAYDDYGGYFAFVTSDNLLWITIDDSLPRVVLDGVVDVFFEDGDSNSTICYDCHAITTDGEIVHINDYLEIEDWCNYRGYFDYFDSKVVSATSYNGSIYFITEDGELYVTGNNNCGQLGFEDLNVDGVRHLECFSNVVDVVAFENSALVITGESWNYSYYLMGTGLNLVSPKYLFYGDWNGEPYTVRNCYDSVLVNGYRIVGSTGIITSESIGENCYYYPESGSIIELYSNGEISEIYIDYSCIRIPYAEEIFLINPEYGEIYVETPNGLYYIYDGDKYFNIVDPVVSKDMHGIKPSVKEYSVSEDKITFVLENIPDYFESFKIYKTGGGYYYLSYKKLENNVFEAVLPEDLPAGKYRLGIYYYSYSWAISGTFNYELFEFEIEEKEVVEPETPVEPEAPEEPETPEYIPLELIYTSIGSRNNNTALIPEFLVYLNKEFSYDATLISLVDADGNSVELTVTKDGEKLVITPTSQLAQNAEYTISLQDGAVYDEENTTVGSISAVFTTVKHTDNFYWTKENVQPFVDKWIEDGKNTQFVNNAILNNFNNTNVKLWLRFIAPNRAKDAFTIGLGTNYWGTTNMDMIERMIVDFDDFNDLHDINVGQILTVAPENTFPFVTSAYLIDKNGERVNTVGNETVTFVVEFNRDMDVSVPLRVRFGSSMPYAEYEISGKYVNARRWEGTYTLKTIIENGRQYINVENGRAADDSCLVLCESDSPRFGFELDTTAAQAMLMQGEATETGIKLTWMQDDFDTLAGYNIYRSDKEDGKYDRLNDYVIPVGECEFFDDTVEPGKRYYYNFTVVKTDLSESTPSGKVSIMSLDTMAPNIYHSPVRTGYTGSNLIIGATVTDNLGVKSVTLYYRTIGASEWKSTIMTPHNDRYSGIINADYLTLDGIEYYIESYDGRNYTYNGTSTDPYSVLIKLAVDANSLGDVDGDGIITNKDALMLLQAANDLLNLTEDQFMRADINGDKELSASEALRILQYVSGKVTTIVGE